MRNDVHMDMKPDLVEFERGEQDSRAAMACGSPQLFWQTRSSWGVLMTEIMSTRFNVTVTHISDMTTHALDSYREGYNRVTRSYVDETFGVGSFQGVLDEVMRFRLDQRDRYLRSQAEETDEP